MGHLNNLSDISKTQVLAKGMNLKNVLKDDFLKELKDKFGDTYEDIVASDIRIMLIPKMKEPSVKEDKKGIIIQMSNVDFIRFEQPSPEHYKDKVVMITSNRKGNLDKVLK